MDDTLIEIFKKLQVATVARFSWLSRSLYALIQRTLIPSQCRLFIVLPVPLGVPLGDYSFPGVGEMEILSLTISPHNNNFEVESRKQRCEECDMVAVRGFLLLSGNSYIPVSSSYTPDAWIYNPTTGQRVALPPPIEPNNNDWLSKKYGKEDNYFLGYDPNLDQYKIIYSIELFVSGTFYKQHFRVLVLEAGSSWKAREFAHPHSPTSKGICVKGGIYYIASGEPFPSGFFVVGFDVKSEEFSFIPLPAELTEQRTRDQCVDLDFIDYNGKATIFDHIRSKSETTLNLWILEDRVGRWSKKSLDPCQIPSMLIL